MKKEYRAPEIEVTVFATEDIITASGGFTIGGDDNEGTTPAW